MNNQILSLACALALIQLSSTGIQAGTPGSEAYERSEAWLILNCQLGDMVSINGHRTGTHGRIRQFTLTLPGLSAPCVVQVTGKDDIAPQIIETTVTAGQTIYVGFGERLGPQLLGPEQLNEIEKDQELRELKSTVQTLQARKRNLIEEYRRVEEPFTLQVAKLDAAVAAITDLQKSLGEAAETEVIRDSLERMRREREAVEGLRQTILTATEHLYPTDMRGEGSRRHLEDLAMNLRGNCDELDRALSRMGGRIRAELDTRDAAIEAAHKLASLIDPKTGPKARKRALAEVRLLEAERQAIRDVLAISWLSTDPPVAEPQPTAGSESVGETSGQPNQNSPQAEATPASP